MESFVINNTEWITSVFWQDIKAKSNKDADKKAKQHNKKHGKESYNALCILKSETGFQAGYVERDTSLPMTNQKALAALFAAKYENCAIKIVFETGIWVCAIGGGLVEPDSDVFGSKEKTDGAFNDFFPLREWDEIIETFSFDESIALIRSLIEEEIIVSELCPLTHELNKKLMLQIGGVLVLLILLAFFGTNYLNHRKQEKARVAAARKAAIMKRLDAQNHQKKVNQLQFKKLWESEPPANSVVRFCTAEMKTFPIVQKGWILDLLTCSKTSVNAQWARLSYGRFTDLPVNAVFDANDPKAKQAKSEWIRKMSIEPRKPGVQLLKKSIGAAHLYQIAKDYQFAVLASWPKPEVRTIPAMNPKEKPQKIVSPYSKCIWELTGAYRPEDNMVNALSGLPGLMITEVVHAYKKDQWIIKGEFYVL